MDVAMQMWFKTHVRRMMPMPIHVQVALTGALQKKKRSLILYEMFTSPFADKNIDVMWTRDRSFHTANI